jgi:deazaflavin-dependent oxidoreductase (nitroreductase family)
MSMQLVTLGGVLIMGLAAIAGVYLLGMRSKSRLVLDPLIWFQRAIVNPWQMRSAGTPGAYAGVIRHRGRISRQPYETPVGVVATDDGFLIAIVYGSRTDWLKNVLAAGSATIVHEGQTYAVQEPEIVPMRAVAAHFPAGDQQGFRWLGTDQALLLHRSQDERTGPPSRRSEGPFGAAIGTDVRSRCPVQQRSLAE